MALESRILKVVISLPSGDVELDDSLDLRIRIHKDALAIQNTCTIDVFNLAQSLRESLLSQFTAWNKRNIETGQPGYSASYINVTVYAGYETISSSGTSSNTIVVFQGQIVLANPISLFPNLGVRLECYSQQLNKLNWVTEPAPTQGTFKSYVIWAAQWMGVSSVQCETSYDDTNITNPFASTHIAASLLVDIQNAYRPNVVAFIDNNILYVKDINKAISSAQIVNVSEFVGTPPMWTEWGVEFTTLFDPKILLVNAVTLQSILNPSLNQTFVISSLDYDLQSRETPFYVKVNANPSA